MKTCHQHVEALKADLTAYKGTDLRLAQVAKVSRKWLVLFKRGDVPNPGTETIDRVKAALEYIYKQDQAGRTGENVCR